MNRFVLAGLSVVSGASLFASAARADMHIDLGGYIREYVIYTDNDESATAAPSDSLHKLDFRREMEIHFTGEKTLESGLTVGVHSEFELGNESNDASVSSFVFAGRDPTQFDEGYIYLSGGWGRINFGAHSGAPFLLQVAAPASDGQLDGMRVNMQGFNPDVWDDGLENASLAPSGAFFRLNYDNTDFGITDRITYLTPKWNGFQAGVSFAPRPVPPHAVDGAFIGMGLEDIPGRFENHTEAAARWDGEFQGVAIAAGAGYATASPKVMAAPGAFGSADIRTSDAGLNFRIGEVSIGGAYKHSNTGVSGPANETHTYVAGIAWERMPWHLGATWYRMEFDANAFSIGLADGMELDRITLGGWYALGPGVSLRGGVSFLDVDNGTNSARDPQQMQAAFGTQVTF